MREAFEAQYPTELDKKALRLDDKGEYALMQTYCAWRSFQDGFQAAYQLQQKRIDAVIETLKSDMEIAKLCGNDAIYILCYKTITALTGK